MTLERNRGADHVSNRPQPVNREREGQPRSSGQLLLVDADDFLIEMIEAGLTLARPKWNVIAAPGPAEAMALLERHTALDAIITEVVFDGAPESGKSFIREVAQRWPDIPIFVMTQLDRDQTHGLDTAEYIAKPPDIDFLVGRIDRIIRRQRESRVHGISLPTFLQILELEGKSCTLFVSHGGRVGEISFRNGGLIAARLDGFTGDLALFAMLSMREHSLRVVDRCDAQSNISSNLSTLLLEWSVREDNSRRDRPSGQEEE